MTNAYAPDEAQSLRRSRELKPTLTATSGRALRRASITATGYFVPSGVCTNVDLGNRLGVSSDWIRVRTGICERRLAPNGGTSELIIPAALDCLRSRGLKPEDLDCIIVATVTSDYVFPPTAALVLRNLRATSAWGFDLSAACSGFVFGLATAASLVEVGRARTVLLCGADRMTALVDPTDRDTAPLFGDGAGVVLVEPADDDQYGLLDQVCRIDGVDERCLYVPAGGSVRPATFQTVAAGEHVLVQEGRAVFRAAVAGLSDVTSKLLERNALSIADIAWFVPHQANARIIQAVAGQLGLPLGKVMMNLNRFGNTGSASIPLCLAECHEQGAFRTGDLVVLMSFGAGFTMGAALLRWAIPDD